MILRDKAWCFLEQFVDNIPHRNCSLTNNSL